MFLYISPRSEAPTLDGPGSRYKGQSLRLDYDGSQSTSLSLVVCWRFNEEQLIGNLLPGLGRGPLWAVIPKRCHLKPGISIEVSSDNRNLEIYATPKKWIRGMQLIRGARSKLEVNRQMVKVQCKWIVLMVKTGRTCQRNRKNRERICDKAVLQFSVKDPWRDNQWCIRKMDSIFMVILKAKRQRNGYGSICKFLRWGRAEKR